MSMFEIGQTYSSYRKCWPHATSYLYRSGSHELTLFIKDVTPCQEFDLAQGRAELVVLLDWSAITICSRFGESIPWGYSSPFRWNEMKSRDQVLPAASKLTPGLCTQIQVALVEADGGTVRAIRSISLTSESTSMLHEAIRGQAERPDSYESPLWSVARICQLYREPICRIQ